MSATHRLRSLLWMAALIGCWVLLLDFGDELEPLRKQAHAARAQRNKESRVLEGANWAAEAARARAVQLEWLGRFMEAETPGLMRVRALDKVKALCDEVHARCQVSLPGDAVDGGSTSRATANASKARAAGAPPEATQPVKVKLTFDFNPQILVSLVGRIENADQLYAIDRLQVTGQRAELQLSVFGVDASEAQRIRSSAGTRTPPPGGKS